MASTLLGGGGAIFATGLALVPCVNFMQMRDVLGARVIGGVRPQNGL